MRLGFGGYRVGGVSDSFSSCSSWTGLYTQMGSCATTSMIAMLQLVVTRKM